VEAADGLVSFEQSGQAAFEDCFPLIFVKLPQHQRVGKVYACFPAYSAHQSECLFLADARASADAVKNGSVVRPIFAEKMSLSFSEPGQLVVIRLKERRLRMTDEKDNPHFRPVPPSNAVPHGALRWMPFMQAQTKLANWCADTRAS
jgi:hypothetical protein